MKNKLKVTAKQATFEVAVAFNGEGFLGKVYASGAPSWSASMDKENKHGSVKTTCRMSIELARRIVELHDKVLAKSKAKTNYYLPRK